MAQQSRIQQVGKIILVKCEEDTFAAFGETADKAIQAFGSTLGTKYTVCQDAGTGNYLVKTENSRFLLLMATQDSAPQDILAVFSYVSWVADKRDRGRLFDLLADRWQ